jgi:hypothetical protein
MATSAPRKSVAKTAVRSPAKTSAAAAKPAAKSPARPAPVAPRKTAAGVTASAKKPIASTLAVSTKSVVVAGKPNMNGSAAKPEAPKTAKVRTVEKVKKAKLVRDSFTMPETEYAALGEVKKACLKAGFEVKKSELLRIGVALVRKLALASLKQELGALAPLKPGRPRKEKTAEK